MRGIESTTENPPDPREAMDLPPLETGRTEEVAVEAPASPTRSELADLLRAQAGTSTVELGMHKMEYSSTGSLSAYVASQSHLLKATQDNPLPTAVPPPIAAVAGLLGVRHVLCLIGLPERGKPFIAHRLSKYLSFFHGAEVKLFDINEVMGRSGGPAGSDLNANFMFDEIRTFMNATSSSADRNMSVPKCSRSRAGPTELQAAVGVALGTAPAADQKPAGRPEEEARIVEELLVEANDRRRKNVDSGKVAILYASDTLTAFKEKWSGTSKERRRWANDVLAGDRALGAKLIFIEVIVDRADILEANLRARERSKTGASFDQPLSRGALREFNTRVMQFQRIYVTLQEDGSEDDLSYIKLINYGDKVSGRAPSISRPPAQAPPRVSSSPLPPNGPRGPLPHLIHCLPPFPPRKVVTNRMHGYLRMRIAQFLSVIHPTPHTIYLSRHGQSEYNVLGKIGGNPPLSPAGEEYARRLGEWVPANIFVQQGIMRKCRLWTSSLQRTILTARHIPHPIFPLSSFGEQPYYPPPSQPNGAPEAPHGDIGPNSGSSTISGSSLAPGLAAAASNRLPDSAAPSPRRSQWLPPPEPFWEQMSPRVYRNLDEIFAGEYEGKTYAEVRPEPRGGRPGGMDGRRWVHVSLRFAPLHLGLLPLVAALWLTSRGRTIPPPTRTASPRSLRPRR